MRFSRVGLAIGLLLLGIIASYCTLWAQTTAATVGGEISDQQGRVVTGAKVVFTNLNTGISYSSETNGQGIYTLPSLQPGLYRANVTKEGFKGIVKSNIELHVQDQVSLNFALQVGSVTEVVTVEGGAPLINTENASVSTVVDRNFAENLPMNGRSFQSLIQLTPGVVLVPSNAADNGQFSVNGQRAASNYWSVDGVGANVGIGVPAGTSAGNGLGGTLGGFSALGGTNSLVSVDAMQEFRIQTSTFAPEFGRTPGAQISIVTRSGTNSFHGTAFDFLRNDALDANNWFNNFSNPPLPKAEERQNDFGGTFNGPVWRNKTFFFFSYEGLRLRLPATTLSTVPNLSSRQNAQPALQPFLNAYPLPNGIDDAATGMAQFNASYSDPASLDAYSLRIDHRVTSKLGVFARYNYSPSQIIQRGGGGIDVLSEQDVVRNTLQTLTVGATLMLSPTMGNDVRFNFSRTNASLRKETDSFGGAVPLGQLPFPVPFNANNAFLAFSIFSLTHGTLIEGNLSHNLQRQINFVDGLYIQKSSHALKFGVDFQRLSPQFLPPGYSQTAAYGSVSNASNGQTLFGVTSSNLGSTYLFHNIGVYGQDSWRISPRLNLTYGLRWDANLAPSTTKGPDFAAVQDVDLSNLTAASLAPPGTAAYSNRYGNIAPRVGLAYQVLPRSEWSTVVRGGVGIFYDLVTSELGNLIGQSEYPNGGFAVPSGNFPWSPAQAPPPAIIPPANGQGVLGGFIPDLQSPYTVQWNFALEQGLGREQRISVSYIGASGRRLLQTVESAGPSANWGFLALVTNAASSNYHAAQTQFERRLSSGLQALASYTFSHSIDTASAGSYQNTSNLLVPGSSNRGSSDFDIRHAFSAAITYDVPSPKIKVVSYLVRGWSLQSMVQARSAPPVDLTDVNFFLLNNGVVLAVRPDEVPNSPKYLFGRQFPGEKAFNPNAFTDPPADANTGNPIRQGNFGRNVLRGFGAVQWDFAVHRDFPLRESLKLQFRAEMFNLLNHPNFGQPSGQFGAGGFGLSSETLNQSLNGSNLGSGAFSPLYQIGGPRSIQFALKLFF